MNRSRAAICQEGTGAPVVVADTVYGKLELFALKPWPLKSW